MYAKPPLPALPKAGGKYTDAVFGTEIMRATDERDCPAPGCGTYYNQWPTFNADNTRLLIRKGVNGDVLIKSFDPDSFALGPIVRRSPVLPGGVTLEWQGATWSKTNPDLIYLHVTGYSPDYPSTGMKLYSYKVSTDTFTLVRDFAPELAPGRPDYLFEMHVAGDDIFTFMHYHTGAASNPVKFIVWKKSTNKVLHHLDNAALDSNNCVPDKSGRFLYFGLNKIQADKAKAKILDLQTGAWQTLYWTGTDDPPGHGDLGTGVAVGRSPFTGGVNFRRLDSPHTRTFIFDMKDGKGVVDWSNDQHMTLYSDDESWVLLGTYDDPVGGPNETGAFEDEIIQLATDGPRRIRRLLHTRTKVTGVDAATNGYQAIPKPTISRDGRFVAYTSNWEDSGRTDLFIARIDPPPVVQRPAPGGATRPRRVSGTTTTAPVPQRRSQAP